MRFEVIELRNQGLTYPKLHNIISKKGYDGIVALLRMFMQKESIRNKEALNMEGVNSDYQPKEYVQREALSQLIYKKMADVYSISKEQFE